MVVNYKASDYICQGYRFDLIQVPVLYLLIASPRMEAYSGKLVSIGSQLVIFFAESSNILAGM